MTFQRFRGHWKPFIAFAGLRGLTMHLKEPPLWPVSSSWKCDEAETKAEPESRGPSPGAHSLGQLLAGGSMIVLWIKHKLPRVRRTVSSRRKFTGSDLNTVGVSKAESGNHSAGLKWSCQLSGHTVLWHAKQYDLLYINSSSANARRKKSFQMSNQLSCKHHRKLNDKFGDRLCYSYCQQSPKPTWNWSDEQVLYNLYIHSLHCT